MEPFWTSVDGSVLRQGDLLLDCWIPEFPPDFAANTKTALVIQADQANLIVITQSCDLERGQLSLVAMCPVWSISDFEAAQATHGHPSHLAGFAPNQTEGKPSSQGINPGNSRMRRAEPMLSIIRCLHPSNGCQPSIRSSML